MVGDMNQLTSDPVKVPAVPDDDNSVSTDDLDENRNAGRDPDEPHRLVDDWHREHIDHDKPVL